MHVFNLPWIMEKNTRKFPKNRNSRNCHILVLKIVICNKVFYCIIRWWPVYHFKVQWDEMTEVILRKSKYICLESFKIFLKFF